jgi:hypothetical protein
MFYNTAIFTYAANYIIHIFMCVLINCYMHFYEWGGLSELGSDSESSSFCNCVLRKFVANSHDSKYVIFVI